VAMSVHANCVFVLHCCIFFFDDNDDSDDDDITVRHHHLNDVIARSLALAGIPLSKKLSGLSCSDRQCSDGLTLIL